MSDELREYWTEGPGSESILSPGWLSRSLRWARREPRVARLAMSTLVEFLTARWDEAEAIASAASTFGSGWRFGSGGIYPSDESNHPGPIIDGVWGDLEAEYGKHIAAHDPAHVLADIAAKRKLVELHALIHRVIGWAEDGDDTEYGELPVCGFCVPKHSHFASRAAVPVGGCLTLRLLAEPFQDHPDYDERWRA